MAYKDNLKKISFKFKDGPRELIGGSFKGVPFFVESHDYKGGRRIQTHEFYKKDLAYSEDLGKNTEVYTFRAYVVGADVFNMKFNLMAALNEEGAGVLLHPYLGEVKVRAGDFTFSENKNEIGYIPFSLSFVQDEEINPLSFIEEDSAEDVEKASSFLSAELEEALGAALDIAGLASDFVGKIEAGVSAALIGIAKARQSARKIASFSDRIDAILNNVSFALLSAEALASEIVGLVAFETPSASSDLDLTSSAGVLPGNNTSEDRLKELNKLLGQELNKPDPESLTPSDYRVALAEFSLNQTLSGVALSNIALLSSEMVFSSKEAANEIRDLIRTSADKLFEVAEDSLFIALQDLATKTEKQLSQASLNLAPLATKLIIEDSPVLVETWAIYGSLEKEEEIIKENNIRHPLFIPAGTAIKYTSN